MASRAGRIPEQRLARPGREITGMSDLDHEINHSPISVAQFKKADIMRCAVCISAMTGLVRCAGAITEVTGRIWHQWISGKIARYPQAGCVSAVLPKFISY